MMLEMYSILESLHVVFSYLLYNQMISDEPLSFVMSLAIQNPCVYNHRHIPMNRKANAAFEQLTDESLAIRMRQVRVY